MKMDCEIAFGGKRQWISKNRKLLKCLVAATVSGTPLPAAVLNWSGGTSGSNGNLVTATNWAENLSPSSNADLVIATRNGNSGSIATLLTGADYTIRSLAFDNSLGRFSTTSALRIGPTTLSTSTISRTLTFGTGGATILSAANNAQVEFWKFATDAAQILSLNYAGRAEVFIDATSSIRLSSATLAGTGGIRKTGPGTLRVESTSAHTGGLTIEGGLFITNSPGGLGVAPASVMLDSVVLNGGTLRFDGSLTSPSANRGFLVGASTGTVDVQGTPVALFGMIGNVPGATGIFAKSGPATLRFASANSYSGGTRLLEGQLRYSAAGSFGSGSITFENDSAISAANPSLAVPNSLRFAGSLARFGGDGNAETYNGNIDLMAGARTVRLSDPATFNGIISNGSLEITADLPTLTLKLTGANTHTGGTTVTSGILDVAAGSIGAVNVAFAATLSIGPVVNVNGHIFCAGELHHAAPIKAGNQIVLDGGTLSSPGGTLTLGAGASISGSGVIVGNLNLAAGSSVTGTPGKTLLLIGGITGAGQATNVLRTISPSTVVNGVETSPIGTAVFTEDFNFPTGFPNTGLPVFRFDLAAPGSSDRVVLQNALLQFGTGGLDLSRMDFVVREGFGDGVYPLITSTQVIRGALDSNVRGTIGGLPAWLRIGNDARTIELRIGTAASEFPYTSGTTYFGRNNYIEYRAGNMPLILVSGHDGSLLPDEIPARTYGTNARDVSVTPLALAMANEITARTGRRPHVIISHLHRTRLDPNREIVEAAQGNLPAEQAWNEFHHSFLRTAREAMERQFGFVLTFDMHGHGHAINRLELGYLLGATELDVSDATMNLPGYAWQSSVRARMLRNPSLQFPALIRGPKSLGERFVEQGVPAWPSATFPTIGNAPFFDGGYITRESCCQASNNPVDAIQIETHFGVRDTSASRAEFARNFADILQAYFVDYFNYSPGTGSLLGVKSNNAQTLRGGSAVTLTISRQDYIANAETVNLGFSGSAVKGTDYTVSAESVSFTAGQSSKTVTLTPAAAGLAQGDRQIVVAINPQYRQSWDSAPVTLTLGDGVSQTVRITALVPLVAKDAGSVVFQLQRTLSGPAIEVPLTWSGTAIAGGHYIPVPSVVIPSGATTVDVPVVLYDDGFIEDDLTLAAGIGSSPSFIAGIPSQAVVTLVDGDRPGGLVTWLTGGLAGNVWQDRSGAARDATTLPGGQGPIGGVTVAGVPGAVTFDGTSATAALPSLPVDPTGAFSIAFYFRAEPGSLTTERNLFCYGDRGQKGAVGIYLSSASQLRTALGTATAITTSGSFNDGAWRHYALTVSPTGAIRIYINGALATSSNVWVGPLMSNQLAWIGWRPGERATAAFFRGALRDFRIYQGAVPLEVVKSLAGGGTTFESWLADFGITAAPGDSALFRRYAFGFKPSDADPSTPLFALVGGNFELEFTRQLGASDVRYEVQRSAGLESGDWETIATLAAGQQTWVINRPQVSVNEVHGRIVLTDASPMASGQPRQFYRLQSRK